jgi:hypothetical protein
VSALDVLPLPAAKAHINKRATDTRDDDEITEFIAAAVERVERHLGRPLDALTITPSQRLACKVVFAEYWRTQRTKLNVRPLGGAASTAALEADTDPVGAAPLRFKLTELLGAPATSSPTTPAPLGTFDPPSPWPDPALPLRCPQ